MTAARTLLVAGLPLFALLAGCSSTDAGDGFSITAPATPGGEHVFTADVQADNYTWDLGDRLTTGYGKTFSHAYDLDSGTLTVTLKTLAGGQSREYSKNLVLGDGQNQKATFLMEAQTDWAVTGEAVVFSAAGSFDPENDPLRYSWSCLKTAEAERKPPHSHPTVGQPFASPPAGSVTTGRTNRTLPAPDHTFPGDLCDALASGTQASTGMTTIAGTFTRTGIYSLYLLASDGAHPTTSGEYRLYVTPPGERPAPLNVFNFAGTLQAGSGGSLQTACGHPSNPSPMVCDQQSATFPLPLAGLEMTVEVAFQATSPPDPAGAFGGTWEIRRGDNVLASGTGPGTTVVSDATRLPAGTYTATVKLQQGANVAFTLDVRTRLDMDPGKVY